jgi:hypothetical protein
MSLDFLKGCSFLGPALPVPFVQFDLERELYQRDLLPGRTGPEERVLQGSWESYRRRLRELVSTGGQARVWNHVLEPLKERLGYATAEKQPEVETREGSEDGGYLIQTASSDACLRAWSTEFDADLDAPARRGLAYRYSPVRCATRVLLAKNERLGVITNGTELRLLIPDQARVDSQVIVHLDPEWRRSRSAPDSYCLLLALASPAGLTALPDIIDKARLKQSKVTKDLRLQARVSIERFIQELLDNPDNQELLDQYPSKADLARSLWHEGLILIYRLLFILKLEAFDDPARAFGFASTSLWRNTYSPTTCLADLARRVLYEGTETGAFLEQGLRTLFTMFAGGVISTELNIHALDGALFGSDTTPVISSLHWGERACASILDCLLWTPRQRGSGARERVHYGPLDVEDLGRVYEALLELEPGIATEPMCRLRRQKLEAVVPVAQGERYRPMDAVPVAAANLDDEDLQDETDADDTDEAEAATGRRAMIDWIEGIPSDCFYLRVGIGRKSTGSYYTPHSFVKFLVQETLSPQIEARSPKEDPNPSGILGLKVLDPAMGSGHFLVEACRYLGDALYEACRLCDEKALECERNADLSEFVDERLALLEQAAAWRSRIEALPVPNNEITHYLPSYAPEGEESGLSQRKALALCRRLVTVHCLYGVDKNPLAVELAKLSLWIESNAEGMPLTFLDHRLVVGDSLTGPFFKDLLRYPGSQEPLDDLFNQGLKDNLKKALEEALQYVEELESSVGVSIADMQAKQKMKAKLDQALLPFKIIAAAWEGGAMLGQELCDDAAYAQFVRSVGNGQNQKSIFCNEKLRTMIATGVGASSVSEDLIDYVQSGIANNLVPALPYDLVFPEVFFPNGKINERHGFNAILGNPPWDTIRRSDDQFFGALDFNALAGATKREKLMVQKRLMQSQDVNEAYSIYVESFKQQDRIFDILFSVHKARVANQLAGRGIYDAYMLFAERASQLVTLRGYIGWVLPSAFHANEGATGVRRLYLENMNLKCCYSFENRKKLFEIDSRFKFALIIACTGAVTDYVACAFYLHDQEWLFGDRSGHDELKYSLEFIRRTGGEYLTLLELRSREDVNAILACFINSKPFRTACEDLHIQLSQELNMTYEARRFTPTSEILPEDLDPRDPDIAQKIIDQGYLVLHEGKTFWHYEDRWQLPPHYCVQINNLKDKPDILKSSLYYRLAYRAIASSTNERTITFSLLPPGAVFGHSAPVERNPWDIAKTYTLILMAATNSFTFDWTARVKTGANICQYILFSCPLPEMENLSVFLRNQALRLICNHKGYALLWKEQFNEVWNEPKPPFTWPVLASDDERWVVRATIDAMIAQAYGLSREQYAHVLSTFSHRSYPKAPALCLGMFDELQESGLDAFTKKYDPYWDIPLNENLPQPAIKLPGFAEDTESGSNSKPTFIQESLFKSIVQESLFETFEPPQPKRRGRKRKG